MNEDKSTLPVPQPSQPNENKSTLPVQKSIQPNESKSTLSVSQPPKPNEDKSTVPVSQSTKPVEILTSLHTHHIDEDVVVHCQLMLERFGAVLDFRLSPNADPLFVGRDTEQHQTKVQIDLTPYYSPEMGISRIHARFERAGDRLFLRDLHSTNGTWVNRKRLIPMNVHEIRHGDAIVFGRLTTRLFIRS